jgi:competence protein ComEC
MFFAFESLPLTIIALTAVVLIAVMVESPRHTFRMLAVAALIVLAIAPEAPVHPSFQMSFA